MCMWTIVVIPLIRYLRISDHLAYNTQQLPVMIKDTWVLNYMYREKPYYTSDLGSSFSTAIRLNN